MLYVVGVSSLSNLVQNISCFLQGWLFSSPMLFSVSSPLQWTVGMLMTIDLGGWPVFGFRSRTQSACWVWRLSLKKILPGAIYPWTVWSNRSLLPLECHIPENYFAWTSIVNCLICPWEFSALALFLNCAVSVMTQCPLCMSEQHLSSHPVLQYLVLAYSH